MYVGNICIALCYSPSHLMTNMIVFKRIIIFQGHSHFLDLYVLCVFSVMYVLSDSCTWNGGSITFMYIVFNDDSSS